MNDTPTPRDPVVDAGLGGLYELTHGLTNQFDLEPGVAVIILFELLADVMRSKAPMEFDAYLTALREEMPKGLLADQQRLNEMRHELQDIMVMTTLA